MDGTLISPSTRHIPESAVKGITKAMEAGHKCFICTGRSFHLAQEYMDEIAIPGIIFCNGAGVAMDGKILSTTDIPQELVYKLMEITDYLDIIMIWYRDVLLYKATKEIDKVVFKDQIPFIKEQAKKSSYEGIELILKSIENAKARLKANVNFDLVMELLFLTIKEN